LENGKSNIIVTITKQSQTQATYYSLYRYFVLALSCERVDGNFSSLVALLLWRLPRPLAGGRLARHLVVWVVMVCPSFSVGLAVEFPTAVVASYNPLP
jgi:hypothetical protein